MGHAAARLLPCLVAACLAVACGSARGGRARLNPTFVEVDPAVFLGDVPCSEASGFSSYVATLIDVTPDANGKPLNFRLPSSPPTACTRSVFFSGVVPQGRTQGIVHGAHEYVAEIEGYAEASLRPKHEGSRVMLSGGKTVSPTWIGSCGSHPSGLLPLHGVDAGVSSGQGAGFESHFTGPIVPIYGKTVTLRGCALEPIEETDGTTRVSVDTSATLGSLECGDGPDQVARFEVTLDDRTLQAECGASVVFRNVPVDEFLEFDVQAFAAMAQSDGGSGESDAAWVTRCYQQVRAGQRLVARCDPLVAVP